MLAPIGSVSLWGIYVYYVYVYNCSTKMRHSSLHKVWGFLTFFPLLICLFPRLRLSQLSLLVRLDPNTQWMTSGVIFLFTCLWSECTVTDTLAELQCPKDWSHPTPSEGKEGKKRKTWRKYRYSNVNVMKRKEINNLMHRSYRCWSRVLTCQLTSEDSSIV